MVQSLDGAYDSVNEVLILYKKYLYPIPSRSVRKNTVLVLLKAVVVPYHMGCYCLKFPDLRATELGLK